MRLTCWLWTRPRTESTEWDIQASSISRRRISSSLISILDLFTDFYPFFSSFFKILRIYRSLPLRITLLWISLSLSLCSSLRAMDSDGAIINRELLSFDDASGCNQSGIPVWIFFPVCTTLWPAFRAKCAATTIPPIVILGPRWTNVVHRGGGSTARTKIETQDGRLGNSGIDF